LSGFKPESVTVEAKKISDAAGALRVRQSLQKKVAADANQL